MKRALSNLIGQSLVLGMALGGVALVAPGVAAASVPACGTTVTHNLKLTGNMNCSSYSGDGLTVGKSGITVNLNGHTITGPGSTSYYGIHNYDHNNVTIENGTVTGYEYGVLLEYTGGSKILHVTGRGDSCGLNFWYSLNGLIEHSTGTGNTDCGIYLYENMSVNVANSKATHNADYGVYDYYSNAALDRVTANSNDGGYGFYIEDPIVTGGSKPAYYVIRNSTANNNHYGFYIDANFGAEYQADLVGNTATNNTLYGFYAEYRGTKGSGNHATGNGTNCYHVPCG